MKVSVIIPVFNQANMTQQCIASIKNHTHGSYEIIIIDNGSIPSFEMPYESHIVDIRILRNEYNAGFPAAINQGIRTATGDIICLLNNDTVVTPGWLERLKTRLSDGYEIVGPMTNYVMGLQKAMTSNYDDDESLNHAANEWAEQNKGITQAVNFVIGFCMGFRKSLFEKLGEFDESMWPCSGEEIDFCFRCREAGGKVGIAKDVYIHHYGSQTFGEMQESGILDYKKVCEACTKHLSKKWGSTFWEDQGLIDIFSDTSDDENIRLNLGCGRYPLAGFINVDQFANVNPDIVCDALNLPFPHESVDEIYCGHMLEHMTLEQGKKALAYWRDLLKPCGKISVTVPDFDVLVKKYLENSTTDKLIELNEIYIYSYCQESHHKYCYSADLLKNMMTNAGLVDVERLPQSHPYFVDPVDWQVAFEGRKAA